MHNLVPRFILEQYQINYFNGHFRACALFLDISGWTSMTQALMAHGKEGAEVLAGKINQVFDPVITAVYEWGGFVTGFAGDSFTAVFPGYDKQTALAACVAALTVQETFVELGRQNTRLGAFTFAIKQGLSAGDIEWGIVGSERHKTYFFRGSAIDNCVKAEQQASEGDIILDAQILALLEEISPSTATIQVDTLPTSDAFYTQLVAIAPKSEIAQRQAPSFSPVHLSTATLFFPQTLWQSTQQGEFREVATIFVSFLGSLDFNVMNEYFAKIMTLVDQFEGHFVEIDFGDKGGLFLVYFGAPIATENDIERALSFALALQTELDEDVFRWRAGITFGTVYAGYVCIPLRDKYACMGNIVNLAARLMVQATWGQVLVSKSITSHPGFIFSALGQFAYKGYARPVSTYLLEGETTARRVFPQKMVGRQNELRQLVEFAQPLFEGKNAGVAIVYGDAGTGKSHLLFALGQKLKPKVQQISGQCDSILREVFNPFVYFLKGYFAQVPNATKAVNKANFENRLNDLLTTLAEIPNSQHQQNELERTYSFLGALLNLSWTDSLYERLDAKGRYQNTIVAISVLIQAECLQQPVMLELEDGHWLDEASHELLKTLTRQTADFPLLILITSRYADDGSRPEYVVHPGTLKMTLDLSTLAPADVQQLAQEILGTPVSAALNTHLLNKAEANPYFTQQILYYLQENNLLEMDEAGGQFIANLTEDHFELTPTLNSVLVARLDRLTQPVKEVVQTAAVLGREFELHILSQMLNRDIHQEIDTASKKQIWSSLNERQYIFKHVLMRDAAYQMQLRDRLRTLHYLAARTGEQLYTAHLASYYGMLAYHFENAFKLGQTEADEQACYYLQEAGQQALTQYNNRSAVDYFSRALAITAVEEVEHRYELLLAREGAFSTLGERELQSEDLTALEALITPLTEGLPTSQTWQNRQGVVYCRQAKYAEVTSNFEAAVHWAARGFAVAEAIDDPVTMALAQTIWGKALMSLGDYPASREHYEMGVTAAEEAIAALVTSSDDEVNRHSQAVLAENLNGLGVVAWRLGDYAAAGDYFERALFIDKEIGDRRGIGGRLNNLGIVSRYLGDHSASTNYFEQSLAINEEIGDQLGVSQLLNNLGNAAIFLEDYGAANRYLNKALAIRQEIGDRQGVANCLSNIGVVVMFSGDYNDARRYFEQSLTINQEIGDRRSVSVDKNNLGLVAMYLGNYAAAIPYFEESLAIRQEIRDQQSVCMSWSNLGLTYYKQGDLEQAYQYCRQAVDLARELGVDFALGDAVTNLGHILLARGEVKAAQVAYQEGFEVRQAGQQPNRAMESLAGLAQVDLVQNDLATALENVEVILDYLKENEIAGNALDPFQIHLTCVQVLQANGDKRSAKILGQIQALLKKQAAKIPPGKSREMYLAIPAHRVLLEYQSRKRRTRH